MKIVIYNYLDEPEEIEISDDVLFLDVMVVSGDDVVVAYTQDEDGISMETYDAGHGTRLIDYPDDRYIVQKDDIPEWNNRRASSR